MGVYNAGMEIPKPIAEIEALAYGRIQILDGQIQSVIAEKAKIVGIVEDYRILFENPLWAEILTVADRTDSFLAVANPRSPQVDSASVLLAWDFYRSKIYPGHEHWQQSQPPKYSRSWKEVLYRMHVEGDERDGRVELNGRIIDLGVITPKEAVAEAMRGYFKGGSTTRELKAGENVKTSTYWQKVPVADLVQAERT